VQFGAVGNHSDESEQIRVADSVRIKPILHWYVAEAKRDVFPYNPAVNVRNPFSGGNGNPQSKIIKVSWCRL